jgi:hypothetical protein
MFGDRDVGNEENNEMAVDDEMGGGSKGGKERERTSSLGDTPRRSSRLRSRREVGGF